MHYDDIIEGRIVSLRVTVAVSNFSWIFLIFAYREIKN